MAIKEPIQIPPWSQSTGPLDPAQATPAEPPTLAILPGSEPDRGSALRPQREPDLSRLLRRRSRSLRRRSSIQRIGAAVLAAAAGLPLVAGPGQAEEKLYDGIAAQVGSGVVLISEVNQMSAPVEVRMRKAGVPEDEIDRMRADVLDRLIESRLIEDVVHRLELDASDREVDLAISTIATEAGVSVAQLEKSVTGHGLTVDEYREKIRGEIERSKVISTMVRSRVRIEPMEIEAIYYDQFGSQPSGGEEVHILHILVASVPQAPRTRAEACRLVEEGRDRILAGETDFATLANEISDANPGRGGDLGWIHSRDMAGWMAPLVRDLEPGQTSGIIENRFGCNLLQLAGRRKFEPVTFEQAKPKIEGMLMRQKMEEEYSEWVETLREQTYIEKKPGFGSGGGAG